jgi:hypothetical protein
MTSAWATGRRLGRGLGDLRRIDGVRYEDRHKLVEAQAEPWRLPGWRPSAGSNAHRPLWISKRSDLPDGRVVCYLGGAYSSAGIHRRSQP